MLIDCDSCTARGDGCADCVVTVLLGAPPAWAGGETVVPLGARPRPASGPSRPSRPAAPGAPAPLSAEDVVVAPRPGMVVEFDEVERRAVQVLADAGLVPPLRHRPAPPAELADRRERPVPGTRAGGPAPRVYGAGHGRTPGADRRGRRTG